MKNWVFRQIYSFVTCSSRNDSSKDIQMYYVTCRYRKTNTLFNQNFLNSVIRKEKLIRLVLVLCHIDINL